MYQIMISLSFSVFSKLFSCVWKFSTYDVQYVTQEVKHLYFIFSMYKYIIIIKSCREHGFSWFSLSFVSIVHRIQLVLCLYWTAVDRFYPDVQHLLVWRTSQENVVYEVTLTSPALSWMSCFSDLNGLEMGGWWPYSCCFVRCYIQNLFSMARSMLVQLLSSFFSVCLVSVHVVHPLSSMGKSAAWSKLRFILLDVSDFHMTDSLSMGWPCLC